MIISRWAFQYLRRYANALFVSTDAYVQVKDSLNGLSKELVDFSDLPQTELDFRVRTMASILLPQTWDGIELERVGGSSDGGYVQVRDPQVAVAVSIGVGADVTWDLDLARRGIRVHLFDHTIARPPSVVHGGTFYRLGLGETNLGRLRSLEHIVEEIVGLDQDNAILKVDVEGNEWTALLTSDLSRFRQILIELHDLDQLDGSLGETKLSLLNHINESHVCVNVHANNYSGLHRFGTYWFPKVVEASFVRRDLVGELKPVTSVSTSLEAPCDPRVGDITLEGLRTLRRDA